MTTARLPADAASHTAGFSRSPLVRPGPFRTLVRLVLQWQGRMAQRRHLRELDDRLLADMGLTRAAAWDESRKPFWRP